MPTTGEVRGMEVSARPVRTVGGDGPPYAVTMSLFDVTERHADGERLMAVASDGTAPPLVV